MNHQKTYRPNAKFITKVYVWIIPTVFTVWMLCNCGKNLLQTLFVEFSIVTLALIISSAIIMLKLKIPNRYLKKSCRNNYTIYSMETMSYIREVSYLRWWAVFKKLFWNTNDSIAKLTISIARDLSLWDKPCYKNLSNYDSDNKCQKLTKI